MDTSLWTVFISEVAGTAALTLLGCGVVANVILAGTKGFGGGWLLINFGWGLAVFSGVFVAFKSGAHLNPAVTLGLLAADKPFAQIKGPGGAVTATIEPTISNAGMYIGAEMIGAFLGAVIMYLAYKQH